MKPLKIVPNNTTIDFVSKRFLAFIVSAIIVIGSIALTSTKGLNFGIDFTGGTLIEFSTDGDAPDLTDFRTDLNTLGLGAISIQEFGSPKDLLVRLPAQGDDPAKQQEAIDKVRALIVEKIATEGVEVDFRRVEFVGPQVGGELIKAGAYAIIFSILGILIYIWFRFEWQFGIAAIIALVHDAVATIGFFALTGMEFNLSTVAAVLMIAGYSINDTVVVFDRVRENLRKFKKKLLGDILNLSINQMLARTLLTSVTTMLALIALWTFGGEVIRGFVTALIFGILIGTYSSNFVAAPILLYIKLRPNQGQGTQAQSTPA